MATRSYETPWWSPILVLALCVPLVVFARWGPDWPAQEFRAATAAGHGVLAWTLQWYAGQALPGYSVLYPYVASVLGASGTAVVAALVTAWSATRLVPGRSRLQHRSTVVSAVLTVTSCVAIGQVPFLLGAAFGSLALVMLVSRRSLIVVAVLSALCSLASPLSGLLLLVAAAGLSAAVGWRRAGVCGTAGVGSVVSLLVGGSGGPHPFAWTAMAGVAFCAASVGLLTGPTDAVLRRTAVVYLSLTVVLFAIPNPVGGNVDRLGKLTLLPVVCFLVLQPDRTTRRRLGALAVTGALCWTVVPMASAISHGAEDPSRNPQYFTSVVSYLRTHVDGHRVEIPFTRAHWETATVASAVPLARGWERQTDLQYNDVLYHPLTASTFRRWLDENAVGFVALPDVPLDSGGTAEAVLLHRAPSYLHPVWSNRHWQVWQVDSARPIVTGPAALDQAAQDRLVLRFVRPGSVLIRIHYSPLWRIDDGSACLSSTTADWMTVRAWSPGRVSLQASFGMHVITGPASCVPTRTS